MATKRKATDGITERLDKAAKDAKTEDEALEAGERIAEELTREVDRAYKDENVAKFTRRLLGLVYREYAARVHRGEKWTSCPVTRYGALSGAEGVGLIVTRRGERNYDKWNEHIADMVDRGWVSARVSRKSAKQEALGIPGLGLLLAPPGKLAKTGATNYFAEFTA